MLPQIWGGVARPCLHSLQAPVPSLSELGESASERGIGGIPVELTKWLASMVTRSCRSLKVD